MKDILNKMTLREKIGQTCMPSPPAVRNGVIEEGGYVNYFKKYPYVGFYMTGGDGVIKDDGSTVVSKPADLAEITRNIAQNVDIPIFVACDAEFGADSIFEEMTKLPTNMAVGAANSPELAYKRCFYWAKELRSSGINWAFGPVCDILAHFLDCMGTRCISDDTEHIVNLIPHFIKGIQDAGVLACAKHFPGRWGDYRDSHLSMTKDRLTREKWFEMLFPIWKAAADCGVDTFMTGHSSIPALDTTIVRGSIMCPASTSPKVQSVLRNDIGFGGLVVTDAVSMKNVAAAYEHEDLYIESLNAGNDVVLFTGNDYIDVIERAVENGRVSIERIDDAVMKVLECKKRLGLFDGKIVGEPMTEEDYVEFHKTNYEISKIGATLVSNNDGRIPFNIDKIKKVTIVPVSPTEKFHDVDIKYLQEEFSKYGIECQIVETINSKKTVKEFSENSDLIVYACFLGFASPHGFPGYSQAREINILFNSLSYGGEKSVIASFGVPSIYYNYYEGMDGFINMYSSNRESMEAFVDGILGKYKFTGEPPVALIP